jgi:hypothetical protein
MLCETISDYDYCCGNCDVDVALRVRRDLDDDHAFEGAHCLIQGGYSRLAKYLASQVTAVHSMR